MSGKSGLAVLCLFLAIILLASSTAAQQPSTYLSTSPLPGWGAATVLWMAEPFCLATWWGPTLCAEGKNVNDRPPGAIFKLDLPGPAWVALVGKTGDVWQLSAVAMARPDVKPGANFVAVTGPTLVTVLSPFTPPIPPPPTATFTEPPLSSVTAAPSTPTPQPPSPTGTPIYPGCASSIAWYVAGDPALGGLGGEVGSVTWCDTCNRGCGQWLWGVSQAQMDAAVGAALERLTR